MSETENRRSADTIVTGGRGVSDEYQSPLFRNLKPVSRILEIEGRHVWGTSPLYDEQGRVHLFFSNWSNEASHYGWVMCCEVGHAVADSPEGPFSVVGTALKGRGGDHWDSWSIHNPTVHKIGDKYALFYMGSDGSKLGKSMKELIELSRTDRDAYWPYFHALVSTKQVGMAVADSLDGPWERLNDKPLIPRGKEGEWDDFVTTNPAYFAHPSGECRLYYKAWDKKSSTVNNGNRKYGVAVASSLSEPFVKNPGNPLIDLSYLGGNTQCEDAYVFFSEGKYHMVSRDIGYYNQQVGLHFTSDDGLDWGLPKIAFREASYYFDEALPGMDREGRFERPQILMKDGRPEYLYAAWVGGRAGTSSAVVLKFDR